ncbi:transglycosylase domain-containing protein [Agrococcus casei]|uniref:Multimodular transpeptidase-transglycosylase n=1 Tax=Agrococcus casei LMG 22410 TaxID=1255656 RepID=A0A1R4GFU5_9MICO|nr:transglycosylase domain-containing protein [Agrococcus casei]SJM67039.1 Multimodular transpeptidase-transglycosylase [Agrococcus casei LMG 22410]
MTARKFKPGSLISNFLGLIGFSVAAGLLVAATITPGLAVTAAATTSGLDLFSALPAYATINQQVERNVIYGKKDGKNVEIARFFNQNRQAVELKQVSEHAQNAAIAAEDRRYYTHSGVDTQSLARAVLSQLGLGGDSGGSTLTMQLVRQQVIMDAFLRGDQETIDEQQSEDYNRKLREIKLAIGLEREYTKNEILLAYLNIANFGGTVYGIQAASQEIFGIPAKDLNPAQAASLMATVKEPSTISLLNPDNFEANEDRRNWILSQMLAEDYITQDEYDEYSAIPVDDEYVNYSPSPSGCIAGYESARYFCDYVQHVLKQDQVYGQHIFGTSSEANLQALDQGGYKIYTSIDLELNDQVTEDLREVVPQDETRWQSGGAVSMLEVGTGRILAMAQNKEYDNREDAPNTGTGINFNTTYPYGGSTGFQPGSTYKIFTLAEWIASGHSVNESVDASNKPRMITVNGQPYGESYDVLNYNRDMNYGNQTATQIMVKSLNTGTIEMASRLDLVDIQATASAMGIKPAADPGGDLELVPSALIGGSQGIAPLSMAEAIQTVANDGVHCDPMAIDKIKDREGNEIPVPPQNCERAIESKTATAMQHVLQQVTAGNSENNPNVAEPIISKTGTAENSEQLWIIGASPKVATAVWTGNIQGNQVLIDLWNNPQRVFRPAMQAAVSLYPGGEFKEADAETLMGDASPLEDVTGMKVNDAKKELEDAGYENVSIGDEVEGSNPKGTVEYTAPGQGTPVSKQTPITIYPSDGSKTDEDDDEAESDGSVWPDIVGMQYSEAQSAIDGAGFSRANIQITWYPGNEGQRCQVLAQNPAAGSSASPGDPISVVLGGNSDGTAASC